MDTIDNYCLLLDDYCLLLVDYWILLDDCSMLLDHYRVLLNDYWIPIECYWMTLNTLFFLHYNCQPLKDRDRNHPQLFPHGAMSTVDTKNNLEIST